MYYYVLHIHNDYLESNNHKLQNNKLVVRILKMLKVVIDKVQQQPKIHFIELVFKEYL